MGENVHEEFTAWFESRGHFAEEELVVFHVLEELDGNDAVVCRRQKLVVDHIAGDDG